VEGGGDSGDGDSGGGGGIAAAVAVAVAVAVVAGGGGVPCRRTRQKGGRSIQESPGAGARKHGDRVSCFLIYRRQQWTPKKQKTKDGLFISVHCSRGVAP